MKFQKLKQNFSVCKVSSTAHVDFTQEFIFLSKTDDEISLVCETEHTPPNTTECEAGWKALKISGILDFGMIGVIAKISNLLAEAKISVFVISTYNTDYILLKSENFDRGTQVLLQNGYEFF
ncbi:MAG: ACT domain-containing protein [Defluviitaleaceae bacterium]|nr:ACT domain-containing protein [Defluviitaleaceae bacterium]